MEFQDLRSWSEDFFKNHLSRSAYGKVFSWWDEIVGENIAAITQPLYLKKDILGVGVKEEAWRAELLYHIPAILEKYREKMQQEKMEVVIKSIRFQYQPYLEKPQKKTISSPLKKESSRSPEKMPPPITGENYEVRLEDLMTRLKDYASGKNLILRPLPSSSSPSLNPQKDLPSRPLRSPKRIDLYYPEIGLYSEFILPPDELQNFDLY